MLTPTGLRTVAHSLLSVQQHLHPSYHHVLCVHMHIHVHTVRTYTSAHVVHTCTCTLMRMYVHITGFHDFGISLKKGSLRKREFHFEKQFAFNIMFF